MRIAVDARELRDHPTGVGRFVGEVLAAWKSMPDAQAHEFIELAPSDSTDGGGTFWEQMVLPALAHHAGADVLFAPAYSGPILSRMPMVVAIHDVSFAAHPEWFGWREGARRRTTARLAARAAARVVTISQFSKREIVAHLGVEESKISVVYPGVTSPGVGRPVTGRRGVLFVGSIFNRRHVPELIQGFARLATVHGDVHLEIVGDNRTSPRLDLAAMISATGAGDRIHLRSYVGEHELRALYASAGAFAFLSEYEGLGLTPLEALAGGVPGILLDTPVAREACGDAALYLPHLDPEAIERALAAVLFNPNERVRILEAAATVLTRYSWTACAHQVLDILVGTAGRA